MIKLGEMQELTVAKKADMGVWLKSDSDDTEKPEDRVLLPKKQVPAGTQIGDKINVFIYRDSDDRIIATVKRPKIVMGEIGILKVVQKSKIGAFLDWGLEKDLFLPFKEQLGDIRLNGKYMVGLYIDKFVYRPSSSYRVISTSNPVPSKKLISFLEMAKLIGASATFISPLAPWSTPPWPGSMRILILSGLLSAASMVSAVFFMFWKMLISMIRVIARANMKLSLFKMFSILPPINSYS
jgi:hypothetical protein